MEHYCILYNPFSGNGRGEAAAAELRERLTGAEIECRDITKLKDYAEFFAALSPDIKPILCGGDGTLHCLVNALKGKPLPENLMYWPAGSGNDFLNDLNLKKKDCPILLRDYLGSLPRVRINDREWLFLNNVAFGIDGYCCEEGDKVRAQSSRRVNYTGIALKGIMGGYKKVNAAVTVDGETRHYSDVWMAPTMNGRFVGGGMMVAPGQDRLNPKHTLTCVAVHCPRRITLLTRFLTIFKGTHTRFTDMVDIREGKHIKVEFDRPTALQIDGETLSGILSYEAFASDLKN